LIKPTDFALAKLREREDFQPLLRDHPQFIDADLMIIAEEFDRWQDSLRRIDLLGLDKDGNLVVIELKRVTDGGHIELQAIRYAAMISSLDLDDVVKIHESYLKKRNKDESVARSTILNFLPPETVISNKPRIVLISAGFAREITTTVLWLNSIGLDIRCMEANLYILKGQLYLDMEQTIPLPSAADYQFKIRAKTDAIQQSASKRRERVISTLVNANILQPGQTIHMIQPPRPGLPLTDAKITTAKYVSGDNFEWQQDGAIYKLSTLTREVCRQLGGSIGSGAFQGPLYWALAGETISLNDKAEAITATVNTAAVGSTS
jgi:hypothetical protein